MTDSLIEQAFSKGIFRLDENKRRIVYLVNSPKKRPWPKPEESVVADSLANLILRYDYCARRIKVFEPIKIGASSREADIVVYDDDKCESPHIVVECKKSEVSEIEFRNAVEQAFSYAVALGARYVWATSGIRNEYFEVSGKRPRARAPIPDIPKRGVEKTARYKYAYRPQDSKSGGMFFDIKAIGQDELVSRFNRAHDALWAGGELNPSDAFDELDKLIFCKLWDEGKSRKAGEPYDFQIITETDEKKTAEELSKRVAALYEEGRKREPEVFKEDIKLNPERIKIVVSYLQDVNLGETDLDSKGRAFETFLDSFFRGDFGAYFTPREIVQFVVDALPLKNNSLVLDTSCGSGGFLLYALDKIRRQASEYFPNHASDAKDANKHYRHWHDFAQNNLFGVEINEQIARVAKMNMIIHDDGHTNVVSADGLLPPEDIAQRTGNKNFARGRFDFIVTNPPFGSTIRQVERAYMENYGFAWKEINWLEPKSQRAKRPSQKTEILFIEQCREFLKDGGHLAIVVPDGVLNNSSLQYVRDGVEEMFRVIAVVSMPQTAFTHTGAGVKSSVLFLKKRSEADAGKIRQLKEEIQNRIKKSRRLESTLEEMEEEKNRRIKEIRALPEKKRKQRKDEISNEFAEKIAALREELLAEYAAEKRARLPDYPIFMAMAAEIGYDATGRKSGRNDLKKIGAELSRFIDAVEGGKDHFFG